MEDTPEALAIRIYQLRRQLADRATDDLPTQQSMVVGGLRDDLEHAAAAEDGVAELKRIIARLEARLEREEGQ